MASPGNRLYPIGYFGIALANALFTQWIVYSRTQREYLSVALLMSSLLQAGLSPFWGSLTDACYRRFGSRKYFLTAGSVPMALSFGSLWFDRSGERGHLQILVFAAFFAWVAQPYFSFLGSIAATEEERVKLSLQSTLWSLAGGVVGVVVGPLVLWQLSPAAAASLAAAVVLVSVTVPTLFLRETLALPEEAPISAQGWRAAIFGNARTLFAMNTLLAFAMTVLSVVTPYLAGLGTLPVEKAAALLNLCFFLGLVLVIPLLPRLTRKFSSLGLLVQSALLAALVLEVGGVAMQCGLQSLPLWCGLLFAFGPVLLVSVFSPPLLLAELTDGARSRLRGTYFGLNGFFVNVGKGAGFFLPALLLGSQPSPGQLRDALGICISAAALAAALAAWLPGKASVKAVPA